jgi:hypothetical protein
MRTKKEKRLPNTSFVGPDKVLDCPEDDQWISGRDLEDNENVDVTMMSTLDFLSSASLISFHLACNTLFPTGF